MGSAATAEQIEPQLFGPARDWPVAGQLQTQLRQSGPSSVLELRAARLPDPFAGIELTVNRLANLRLVASCRT